MRFSIFSNTAATLLAAACFITIAVLLVFQLHKIEPDSEAVVSKFSVAEFTVDPNSVWETASLPHDWLVERLATSQLWYRFTFDASPEPTEQYALYLPVISENAVAYLNGVEIGNGGSIVKPLARNWPGPLIFPIAPGLLVDGKNDLKLHVFSEPPGRGLLPAFYFGQWEGLASAYNYRKVLKETALGVFLVILLVGAFFLFFIAYQRTEPSEFGWAGATFLGLAGRLLHVFFHQIPFPQFLWDWWQHICVGYMVVFISIFVNRYFNLQMKAMEISSAVFITTLAIVSFMFVRTPELKQLYFIYGAGVWGIASLAVGCVPIGLSLSIAIRKKNIPAFLIFSVGCVMFGLGFHDMLFVNGIVTRQNGYLLHYSIPLVALLLTALLIIKLLETSTNLEELNSSLEQRVKDSTSELAESYEKVQKMEQEKILAAERERFNRDMHDGLGGHLSTALALAEMDAGPNASLTRTIRDATDEMRLMLDTAEATGADIGMIIGSLRQKLQRQTEAAGFELIWNIEDTSPIDSLGPGASLNLIRFVQEAVTNALRHSGGSAIRISVKERDQVVLEIADNGRCVNFGQHRGNGIPNLEKRATELGAKISFNPHSEFGGLSVALSVASASRAS